MIVVVDPSPIVATNDSISGINGATGATNALNAFTGDTINGAAATPTNAVLSVVIATIPPQLTIDTATGSVSVVAGSAVGTYTFDYQICEKLNPANCKTATESVTVGAAVIAATPDAPASVNGATGNPSLINAYTNDMLNGVPVTLANITGSVLTSATPVSVGAPVPTLDPSTGTVAVPVGTPAGTYTITYRICEKLNPANCSTTSVIVVVDPAPVVATSDTISNINGANGATAALNAFVGDTINGQPATTANSTVVLATGFTVPPQLVFTPATGAVDVKTGTPIGSYTFDYKLCEILNPTNCKTATETVNVVAAPLVATNDAPPSVNGAVGNPTLVDAFANDTFNGVAIDLAKVTATVTVPATPIGGGLVPAFDTLTGNVAVPVGTPSGTYTITYQLCDNINPVANCKMAIVTVLVNAALITATADAPAVTDGTTGNPTLVNAYANDTLNGTALTTPALVGTIIGTVTTPATPASVGAPVPVLDPVIGNVSVPANTPAGSYTIAYKICEKLNPANCANTTITVPVSVITANADTPASTNGAIGNPILVNAFANDTVDGVALVTPALVATIKATVTTPATPIGGGPVPALDPATGIVSVPPGTPAGTYTITYKICENANPTFCSTATVTVPVSAAPISATADTPTPVNGVAGNVNLVNAFANDTLNGVALTTPALVATITGTVTAPATPATAGAPVPALDPTTGVDSVPPNTPAGTYTIAYRICERLNAANCANTTVTVVVDPSPLVATADTVTGINGASGATAVTNVLTNDTINGVATTTASVTISLPSVSIVPPQLTFDPATGNVDVKPGTPAGTYMFDYQICEKLNPTNCKTAAISVTTIGSPVVATDDTAAGINGATGAANVLNAFTADTINGAAATPANSILSVASSSTVPPQLTFDPAAGNVSVVAGAPAGTYIFKYQICEKLNPTNCMIATESVTTVPSLIIATPDTVSNINGTSGATAVVNALTGDTINGVSATATNSILSVATSSIVPPQLVFDPATGAVDVKPGTPAGTYTFNYQICENLNPTNCKTSTITANVVGGPVVAVDDVATGINGASGATAVINAYTSDTINGVVATTSNSTITLAASSTVPPELVFTPATGAVDVKPGTPLGTYTFKYQICENLNPANCQVATETVTVGTAVIAAAPDTPANVNGATGSPALVNAYANDMLNSVPVTPSTITGTVTTPPTPINGGPVPALDPATGTVSVPAGTPAGAYTIAYKICEKLNPSNCDNTTITVNVDAAPIVATSDTVSNINGLTGATAVLNAFTGDTLNGVTATPTTTTVILAASSTVPTELVFTQATGAVDVKTGTPAGAYTFDYKLCEILNPTNCKTATETVNVVTAPLVATDDTPPHVNGATGNPSAVNAFVNDSFNGAPLDLAKITPTVKTPATPLTAGAPVPVLDPTTGIVSVPLGTPADTYTITYQLCDNVNPVINCKTAIVTVVVDVSPIVATADTPPNVNGATGNPIVVNVYTNDTLNGTALTTPALVATVNGTILTPATPTTAGASVPVLDPVTGIISVPAGTPAGTYTIKYQICEKLNPANCANTVMTVPVSAAPIVATDDTALTSNGAAGNPSVVNAYANDTLNGAAVTPANVIGTATTPATPATAGASVPVLDPATGIVSIPAGTPAGTYTIKYQICEKLNSSNCATASITVPVAVIVATADMPAPVNGATGNPSVINAFANDTLNGSPATPATVLSIVTMSANSIGGGPVPVLDPITGIVSVPPGTPEGIYTIAYQICDKANPTFCSTANITVPVATAPLVATNDTPPNVNGATGSPFLVNAFANDSFNGAPIDLAKVTPTIPTPATPVTAGAAVPALDTTTGTISVPAGTPAGTYTIIYQLCEILNPTNCKTATVTVVVDAAPIVATADTLATSNGTAGNPSLVNVYANDTLNGVALNTPTLVSTITGTVTTPATPATAGAPVPGLDPLSGIVSVPAGTPAGTYTIKYQICEKLNLSNCANTTVTVPVSVIAATADASAPTNGATGNPSVLNAFTNDTLNGSPATPATVLATVTTPAISIGGGPVPALDPTTGIVSVPPGTPAGSYTIAYQICDKANPTFCSTATITVPVLVAPIAATPDTPPNVNGATGNPSVVNAFANDTLNNAPVTLATITGSVTTTATPVTAGALVPVLDPTTGVVSVPPNTPAGSYTIAYKICEKLNPTNCANSTVTVVVDAAPIVASNDQALNVNGVLGNPSLVHAYSNDTLNGVALITPALIATINGTVTTPAASIGGGPVPLLDQVTGTVSVPAGTPGGNYTIAYKICEKLNPTNCSTATITVPVSVIAATADTPAPANGTIGNTNVVNAYANDTLDGIALTTPALVATINGTVTTPAAPLVAGAPVPVLDPLTGVVSVPPGTPAGSYTITYQICDKANPTYCATSTVTLPIIAGVIAATPDSPAPIVGAAGGKTPSVLANDTLGGAPVVLANITLTPGTAPTTTAGSITLQPDGTITVAVGTPTGTYVYPYTICEKLNPTNCSTSNATIIVASASIVATPDTPATVFDSKLALTNVINVLSNDTLNGVAVTLATVTLTPVGTLPADITLNPDGSVDIAQFTVSGTYTFDYKICEKLNPTNCKTATATLVVKKSVPAISGIVFLDSNGNSVKDPGEKVLTGYTVNLMRNGVVVATTKADANGYYNIADFPPAAGYQLQFVDPTTGVTIGVISGLDFTMSTILTNVNQPVDPSGVVYDSVSGLPVAGAMLTLTDASGNPLPAACILPGQQNQTTLANGQYRFDVLAGGAAQCPVGQTNYKLSIASPPNYLPAPSSNIPPQATALNANACATAPAACLVAPSSAAPSPAAPTPYYLAFVIASGSPNIINNHIPLDPILTGKANFTKTALKTQVHRGERVPYVIQAVAMNFTNANVVDIIPPGFDYMPGSALVNGVAATPAIAGNQLTFSGVAATGGALKVELTLIANAAVQPGPATNKAQLLNFFTGNLVFNARATITVVADPVLDCGEIIGRVFEDKNRNGYQDEGEVGIPGVRIATVNGNLITTDKFGRFHVGCADLPDQQIGSNFVMKLDTRTLPTGYRLTTENPRDVRLTAGKMTKLNFGASIARLVDLDLNGKVFVAGSTELLPQWRAGIATLIAKLDAEPSTLRLTYHNDAGNNEIAAKRLTAVSALIASQWSNVAGRYKLPIETRSVDATGANQ